MNARSPAVVAIAWCAAIACEAPPADSASRERAVEAQKARGATVSVDTVASGLEVPWAVAFAPDGRVFVSERAGRIRVIENGKLRTDAWATLPVAVQGEAGLMGIALAPDFATSHALYVVGTFDRGDALVNRVIRFTDENGYGVRPSVILDGIPAAVFHAGDAIAFGLDGLLYVATGDARTPGNAQDERSLAGKILRMRPDGTVPADNPTSGSLVFARGVRNVQGLTWDPATGQAFATDHGPSGFPNELFRRDRDELNAIMLGGNFGWPTVSGKSNDRRFVPPLIEWSSPGIAPSGAAVYTGPFSPWRGNVFIAALKGEQLRRVSVAPNAGNAQGWRVVGDEPMFVKTFGRLRALAMGPDGMLYFTTSNRDGRGVPRPGDDHLFRIRVRP